MGKTIVKGSISSEIHSINNNVIVNSDALVAYLRANPEETVSLTLTGDNNISLTAYRIHTQHIGAKVSKTEPLTDTDIIYKGDTIYIEWDISEGYHVSQFSVSDCCKRVINKSGTLNDSTVIVNKTLVDVNSDILATVTSEYIGTWHYTDVNLSIAIPEATGSYTFADYSNISELFNENMLQYRIYYKYDNQPSYSTNSVTSVEYVLNGSSDYPKMDSVSSTITSKRYTSKTKMTFGYRMYYCDRQFELRTHISAKNFILYVKNITSSYTNILWNVSEIIPPVEDMKVYITRIAQRY